MGEYITKSGRSRYRPVGDRCEQLKKPISEFFIIVNAATVGFDSFVEAFRKSQNDIGMIVLDECHRFATKTSNRGSNLLKLDAEYKVAMTGTLIVNSPISAYVPLSWTGNDKATLTNNGFGDRGWLAIAIVIFAIWRPSTAILSSFLFGGLYILCVYIPGLSSSAKELINMLPYLVTIIVLVIISMRKKRENQPSAHLGLSYFREER